MNKNKRNKIILWCILGIVFLYPFYCLLINEILRFSLGTLYTFGLELKDFITVWIALGGIFGVVYNIILMQKRITIQEEQQVKQQEQFDKQYDKQNILIEIQQKQLRDNRFSLSVQLLGDEKESSRIGGVYNLYFLANEFPNDYLNSVCEILCTHIRSITNDVDYQKKYREKPSYEIQTILNLLFKRVQENTPIFSMCKKNLSDVYINGVNFYKAIIANVVFANATIKNGAFFKTKLTGIDFNSATLSDCQFKYANLKEVSFKDANIIHTLFAETSLTTTYFRKALITDAQFKGVLFNNVSFTESKLMNSYFIRPQSNLFDFREVLFYDTWFSFSKEKEKDVFKQILIRDLITGINEENLCIKINAST